MIPDDGGGPDASAGIAPSPRVLIPLGLLVAAAAFLPFLPALGNGYFPVDDFLYITENRHVLEGLSLEGFRWAFSTFHAANWHPVAWLSHMADVSLFGGEPAGHHLTNLLLHSMNAVLLFLLFAEGTGKISESVLVALLFAVHPMRVESVVWISERKDLLCAFFFLLGARAWLRWCRTPSHRHYGAVVAWFVLSLLSKPMAVTFPFVLLLLDGWPLGRLFPLSQPGGKKAEEDTGAEAGSGEAKGKGTDGAFVSAFREKWPLFLLSGLSCVVTFWAQSRGGGMLQPGYVPFSARILNALSSYGKYLELSAVPSRLSSAYPHSAMAGVVAADVAIGMVLLATGMIAAVRFRRKAPAVTVGWFWFIGTLVPVIGLVQVGIQGMADRYSYLPHAGLSVAVVFGVSAGLRRGGRKVAAAAALAGVVVLSFLSVRQSFLWRDPEGLFRRALEVSGVRNPLAWEVLGYEALRKDRPEEAVRNLRHALEIYPHLHAPYLHIGNALLKLDRPEEAETNFRVALKSAPDRPEIHVALGRALVKQKRYDEAEKGFREALRFDPAFPSALEQLGALAALRKGDEKAAYPWLEEAIRKNPGVASPRGRLGAMLAHRGDFGRAIPLLREAVRISPTHSDLRYNLAVALEDSGDLPGAEQEFMEVVRLNREADGLAGLGRVLARRGRLDEGAALLAEALVLKPEHTDALYALALARKLQGRGDESDRLMRVILRVDPGNVAARAALAGTGGNPKAPHVPTANTEPSLLPGRKGR